LPNLAVANNNELEKLVGRIDSTVLLDEDRDTLVSAVEDIRRIRQKAEQWVPVDPEAFVRDMEEVLTKGFEGAYSRRLRRLLVEIRRRMWPAAMAAKAVLEEALLHILEVENRCADNGCLPAVVPEMNRMCEEVMGPVLKLFQAAKEE
jgi:hypothetical protein